ncbi:MAG: cyanophycinase [Myxococcota bacterium]
MMMLTVLACVAMADPREGHLILAGGGPLDPVVYERFISLAGGPHARILVVPTAAARPDKIDGTGPFQSLGADNLVVLHAQNREQASSVAFVHQIEQADGVWFTGGRQWRLMDAYLGTDAHRAFSDLLARGGVIGGTSAGASAQASLLVRGDTKNNQILLGDHQQGFGWLEGAAVDQHLLVRDRLDDMLSVLQERPDVLGIGLDEGVALVVHRRRAAVIGRSVAVFYDPNTPEPYLTLSPGDTYDLNTRSVERAPQP